MHSDISLAAEVQGLQELELDALQKDIKERPGRHSLTASPPLLAPLEDARFWVSEIQKEGETENGHRSAAQRMCAIG